MKKSSCIVLLLSLLCSSLFSQQSYINYVLGKYVGTVTRNGCTSFAATPGVLYLTPDPNYSFTVYEYDSCYFGTAAEPWSIQVFADSTLASYNGPGATGRLYSNDSIHLTVFLFGSTWCHRTFNGFKLYSSVGIDDLDKPENELLISPQPASDMVYIQSTQLPFKKEDVPTILDLNGKQIFIPILYINSNTYKLDASTLTAGMYFLVLQTEKGVVRKKLVIEL